MTAIGKRLRWVRKTRGLTIKALAELTGLRFQQIQKYETAANGMSVPRLIVIAQALNVPPSYFLEFHACLPSATSAPQSKP